MKIRNARAEEQMTLVGMVMSNQLNPFDIRWTNFIVAVDENDKVLGCGQLKRYLGTEEMASIVVNRDQRGKGISDLIIRALLSKAKRPLWLACESPLKGLYEKYGFEEVLVSSQLPAYFQTAYWSSRTLFSMVFSFRNTYLAFMVLRT